VKLPMPAVGPVRAKLFLKENNQVQHLNATDPRN
jgi:hypothetical protein